MMPTAIASFSSAYANAAAAAATTAVRTSVCGNGGNGGSVVLRRGLRRRRSARTRPCTAPLRPPPLSFLASAPSSRSRERSFRAAAVRGKDPPRGRGAFAGYSAPFSFAAAVAVVEEEISPGGDDNFGYGGDRTDDDPRRGHCHTCSRRQCDLFPSSSPLPPPLPEPLYSFHRRVVPPNLVALSSGKGRRRFHDALSAGTAEAYFPLSEQFTNQSDPALCGPATLLVVLNALAVDPNVRWRGGWRWYGDEDALLERCCLDAVRVRRAGLTMDEFGGLARCHGAGIVKKQPSWERPVNEAGSTDGGGPVSRQYYGIDDFRRDVRNAACTPPRSRWDEEYESGCDDDENEGRWWRGETAEPSSPSYFVVTSFDRSSLGQTGEGHFSPIAAYHSTSDSCLVLDVARFKYPPYWVTVNELYNAMVPEDGATGRSRGWFLMSPPALTANAAALAPAMENKTKNIGLGEGAQRRRNERRKTVDEREGKRPASCAPLAGSGARLCPVEEIKVKFCPVAELGPGPGEPRGKRREDDERKIHTEASPTVQ